MFSVLLTAVLASNAAAGTLELEPLLAEVGSSATRVQSQRATTEVARSAVGVAGAMEDPTVSFMVEGVGREMGPMMTYRFMQPLGSLLRRGPEKDVARALVGRAEALTQRAEWDARSAAARGFYELWRSYEVEEILNRQLKVLERMRISAQARYEAGMPLAHHAMLRAEAEISTVHAEKAALAAEREAMIAMVNALRNRPQDTALGTPVLPERPPLPALAELVRRASSVPEVKVAEAMRSEAAARQTVAERMYLPMPMAGAFIQQEPQQQPAFGAEVALSVPLWFFDRQKNEVAMANAMGRAAKAEQESMRVMAEADLRLAYSRVRSAELSLESIEKVAIPRLRATVESAEAAYRSGSEGFLELLESILALQRLEAERAARIADRGIAWFELSRILGGPVAAPAEGAP